MENPVYSFHNFYYEYANLWKTLLKTWKTLEIMVFYPQAKLYHKNFKKRKNRLIIILKETRVAFLNGLALGAFSFLIVGIYLLLFGGLAPTVALTSAVCVGVALWFAMTISGFTGAVIPICFYRMGIDPAVASGPLITTVNDLVAVVSYYGLAWALLVNLV